MEEFPNNLLLNQIQTLDSGFQFYIHIMAEEQHILRESQHSVVYSNKKHPGQNEKTGICKIHSPLQIVKLRGVCDKQSAKIDFQGVFEHLL